MLGAPLGLADGAGSPLERPTYFLRKSRSQARNRPDELRPSSRSAEPNMPDALELLRTRRSVKPADLAAPGPSVAEIDTLLAVASRVPDHGKLAPWRFIVFAGNAGLKAGENIAAAYEADHPHAKPEEVAFERLRLARAPLVVAVVSRAAPHVKIPEWEQVLSAGAAAMNLVNAVYALGYAASWITEWYAYDRRVLDALGVSPHERLAGFVHIGTPVRTAEERRRPCARRVRKAYRSLRTRNVLHHGRQRPRPASRSVQSHRRAAADRMDQLDQRQRRRQSRPLFVFQRASRAGLP